MRPDRLAICGLLLLLSIGVARADETTLNPLQCGDDEREDAGGTCLQETAFTAGTVSGALHLKVGGEAAGCNSEWAVSLEFDLGPLPQQQAIVSATLVVRKTGYSDDSQGFAYLGAFAYPATGSPVAVARADLTPETALDVLYPSAANTDLSFDVTAAVQELASHGGTRAGLLLAGVYSEVGYEDWISVGGTAYPVPPRLVVVTEGAVATERASWSGLKGRYR